MRTVEIRFMTTVEDSAEPMDAYLKISRMFSYRLENFSMIDKNPVMIDVDREDFSDLIKKINFIHDKIVGKPEGPGS